MNMKSIAISLLLLTGGPAIAADMPAKAPKAATVVGYPYQTAGLYWGIGTEALISQAQVNTGGTGTSNLFAAGAALNVTVGYSRPISGGTGFMAIEATCGWQNLGGTTQVVSAVTNEVRERISCVEGLKLGGPILNVLNLLPSSGLPLPTLPNIGAPSGSSHPYLFAGAREGRVLATDNLTGVSREVWQVKAEARIGLIQQFDTGIAMDVYLAWDPKQGGFAIGGPSSANLGNTYIIGAKLLY
jgi:hypothetical protein